MRHALVEEILPQVELRMGQLHEAYQQRSQVAQQVAESVLEQRERILHLSEILSQLDWISLSGGRVDL